MSKRSSIVWSEHLNLFLPSARVYDTFQVASDRQLLVGGLTFFRSNSNPNWDERVYSKQAFLRSNVGVLESLREFFVVKDRL